MKSVSGNIYDSISRSLGHNPSLRYRRDKNFFLDKKNTIMKRFFGFVVIIIISAVVVITAIIIIKTAVNEKHSSIHFIKRYFKKTIEQTFQPSIYPPALTFSKWEESQAMTAGNCLKLFNGLAIIYNNSVVDYLAAKKENYFFKNRKRLAAEFGMKDYRGDAQQNRKLLKLLFMKFKDIPDKTCVLFIPAPF